MNEGKRQKVEGRRQRTGGSGSCCSLLPIITIRLFQQTLISYRITKKSGIRIQESGGAESSKFLNWYSNRTSVSRGSNFTITV
ncbi:hypothetical protein [Okeania sp. SIO3B5]|uniref:hypothetical protein n=1 Tax=Okeania sp. SIO3B5 TaxID=2607811 RepID=UPI0025F92F41|nr:hypothetical protein [Okeania sp. SIO3B5]